MRRIFLSACATLAWGSGAWVSAQAQPATCLDYTIYAEAERAADLQRPSVPDPCGPTQWRLDSVQVYGDRTFSDPGSFSVLTEADILDMGADHPAEILNTLAGVNIQANSGQEHLLAIRSPVFTGGAGQGSFLILENGVPTRSAAFGNVNMLLEPHYETAEALEVVRGPGSAKYGSNAVHGLINVILADPGGKALSKVQTSYGSLGRYKGDAIFDQGYLGRASLSVHADTGWRDTTGLFQLKGSGVVETVWQGWDVTAWGAASHLEQETADFLQGADAYKDRDQAKANDDPLAYRDAWTARGAVRLERSLDKGVLQIIPFARVQQMDFRQHFLPYKGFEKNGHSAIGAQIRYAQAPNDTFSYQIGSDVDLASGYLRESQPEPFGFFPGDTRFPAGIHYDYTVDTTMLALWGEADWRITDRLTGLFGVRGEAHDYDYRTRAAAGVNGRFRVPENRRDTFAFLTPKLGLVYTLGESRAVYVNYARGARAPQASDLYRLQSLQGVAEADVETLDSLELGLRGTYMNTRLVYDIAVYGMTKQNVFFRDANGLNVSDGSTRHQGVEAQFDFALAERLDLRGNLSFADHVYTFDRVVGNSSEIIRDGNAIDTAPEWLADLALVWRPVAHIETILSAEHVGAYFTNPANSADYPGHTVLNLRAKWDVSDTLEIYGSARNLTDLSYADRADFAFGNARYFPGEPMNITVGLRKVFK